jgi:hypothetical protein
MLILASTQPVELKPDKLCATVTEVPLLEPDMDRGDPATQFTVAPLGRLWILKLAEEPGQRIFVEPEIDPVQLQA